MQLNNSDLERLRLRLAGRSKRQLIEQMITRSPHSAATSKLLDGLEAFPLLMLLLAQEFPTRIWVLDRGERPSTAEILDETARFKRWHSRMIPIDECEGLTDVVDGSIAIVVSWKSLLTIRHEFAHATTTFLSTKMRSTIEALYRRALHRGEFVEPLAAESMGEYIACAMSYYLFNDLREELEIVDPFLCQLVGGILRQAEATSEELAMI